MSNYPVMLVPLSDEDGGGWVAMVEDLPGCLGDGDTPEAAFADACAAMKEWMSEAHRLGRAIPAPTKVDVASAFAAKTAA